MEFHAAERLVRRVLSALIVLSCLGSPVLAATPEAADPPASDASDNPATPPADAHCTTSAEQSESDSFRFLPSETHDAFEKQVPPGTPIRSVRLVRYSVFDLSNPSEDRALYRLANKIHFNTHESVIRSQLLFTEGSPYNSDELNESERILRRLQFLHDANIRPWRLCPDGVDVEVITRDLWTFTPSVSFNRSGGSNSYAVGFRDSNFLGTGKQIIVLQEDDDERSGTTFFYSDPAIMGSRWQMDLSYTDNDDGYYRSVEIERPFFSVHEQWSAGGAALQQRYEDNIYYRGDEIAEFEHKRERYSLFAGIADSGTASGRVGRWLFGYVHDDHRFGFSDSNLPPAQLPEDRKYSYPYIGYQSLEDRYINVHNVNYLGRSEDLFVGERYSWRLGWSDDSFGSTRDLAVLQLSYDNTLLANDRHLWMIGTDFNSYLSVDDSEFENLWWSAITDYHYKQTEKWSLFGHLRLDYTRHLTEDQQVVLGGENGLRGYESNYQVGDRSFLINVEQRYYLDWHPFRLVRVGVAGFVDVGRAWYDDRSNGANGGTLADAGIGLRLNSSRAAKGAVVHIDLAFPFVTGDDVDSTQFLVRVRKRF